MKLIQILLLIVLFDFYANYHTYYGLISMERPYYDCIYVRDTLNLYTDIFDSDSIIDLDAWSLVPYCRRPTHSFEREENSCQGQLVSFTELREQNRTTKDLFFWHASIDILNAYEMFLDNIGQDQIYCRCIHNTSFGINCEYVIDEMHDQYLEDLILNSLEQEKKSGKNTCYRGVIADKCLNVRCLNWQRICDGLYDCIDGIDEQFCTELEMNTCQDDEYRCQNGFCIPLAFSFDLIYDCLDRSDESYFQVQYYDEVYTDIVIHSPQISPECLINPSIFCDECSCFSSPQCLAYVGCGDKYTTNPFQLHVVNPTDLDNWLDAFQFQHFLSFTCWRKIFCSMTISILYSNMIVENPPRCDNIPLPISFHDIKENKNSSLHMDSTKQNAFSCPSNLFIYPNHLPDIPYPPNVVFKYDASTFSSTSIILPTYVCYNGTWCNENNQQICRTLDQIGISEQTNINFLQFYSYVRRYFYMKCRPPNFSFESVNKSKYVYQCKNSSRWISQYRIQDGTNDCLLRDDETFGFDQVCSLNLTDRMTCATGCIPRRNVLARKSGEVCELKEITYIAASSMNDDDESFARNWLRSGSGSLLDNYLSKVFLFRKICDGIAHDPNADDERNCHSWRSTCNRLDQQCNGYWDCLDGRDEIGCNTDLDGDKYRYCFKETGLTFIEASKLGDGHIDCLGASDERDGYCLLKYPDERSRRFRCANASECVLIEQICDGYPNCPDGDDELPCPWRKHLNERADCSIGRFACQDENRCRIRGCERCQVKARCSNKEDIWFCDLIDPRQVYLPVKTIAFNEFPIYDRGYTISNTIESLPMTMKSKQRKQTKKPYCHRGLPVSQTVCLCPPSFYGEQCQYESDRLSIDLGFRFKNRSNDLTHEPEFFRIIVTLVNENNQRIDREELIVHYAISNVRHFFYLVYGHRKDEKHQKYSVRFDVYSMDLNSIVFHSTQQLPVRFAFLPVNRLALIIDLTNHSKINESQPVPNDVCRLGRYGSQCRFIDNRCLETNQTCFNGGTCYPFDIRMERYNLICLCPSKYFGDRCQYESARIQLEISRTVQRQLAPSINMNTIALLVVYFADILAQIPQLNIRAHFIYSNVSFQTPLTIHYYRKRTLSDFIFVQLFYHAHENDYFLVGLHADANFISFERTTVLASYKCSHVNEILNWTMYNLSANSKYIDRVKFYHRCCYQPDLHCFYDDTYMCICDSKGKFECFLFDHSTGDCSSTKYFCLNDGICRHTSLSMTKQPFICACPVCYYGDLCQFTTTQYTVSLDAFQINSYLFICICILFLIGIIANYFAIDVFLKDKACQVGSGFYLRTLSLIGEINLIFFFIKMTQVYMKWPNHMITCHIVEYIITTFPLIFDWLAACVAVERLIGVIKKTTFNKTKSKHISKFVITSVVFIVICMNIHEIFYREIIDDPKGTQQSWCIINYPRHLQGLNSLRKILNLIHLITPFLINFGSTIILLYLTIQRKFSFKIKNQQANNNLYWKVIQEEISLIKHSLISPCLLILFGLPRLIFAFGFACIEYSWQENFYMISYFISIIPMTAVLFIFVFPSSVYFKLFKQNRFIQILI